MATVSRALQRIKQDLQPFVSNEDILAACQEMNKLENQADTLTRKTMAKLFKRGNDPLTVMKWKEIIDLIDEEGVDWLFFGRA